MAQEDIRLFFMELRHDIFTAAEAGLEAGAQELPEILKQNIVEHGARGGNKPFEPVPVSWLRRRKTWPGSLAGVLTPNQLSYVDGHIPLVDTGTLLNSMTAVKVSPTEWIGGPSVAYAANHINGVPGPDGPKQLFKRDFVFKVDGDDDDLIHDAADEEFGRQLDG